MKILIFGASGMLGQALVKEFAKGHHNTVLAPSRMECDLLELGTIHKYIEKHDPDVVINAAGLISIDACEKEAEKAFTVNAAAVERMAHACRTTDALFIQVSTDHYFIDDGRATHKEDAPIHLVNNYAKFKYAAEIYALIAPKHLILRTNIIGFRNHPEVPTFIEWALDMIANHKPMRLFTDYYASSMDVYEFAEIVQALMARKSHGLFNVGARDVLSKAEFIERLAKKLQIELNDPTYVSVESNTQLIRRANTLGLDVSKIERELGRKMPSSDNVIDHIIRVYDHDKDTLQAYHLG